VRIVTVPGERVVDTGIFSYVRHPNYAGVALELAALPLVHGAWVTAVVATLLNGVFLAARIRAEEDALRTDENYAIAFGPRRTSRPSASLEGRR
jgi:methyltransferase